MSIPCANDKNIIKQIKNSSGFDNPLELLAYLHSSMLLSLAKIRFKSHACVFLIRNFIRRPRMEDGNRKSHKTAYLVLMTINRTN